ncbi:MAG: DUF2240 family protein [Halobacteriaceae archaeon]
MTLRTAVAVPFRQAGTNRLDEGQFVVALSLDRDWFSPDQAKRLVDLAVGEGLLEREAGSLVAAFDVRDVTVPDDYAPDDSLFEERSPFERALDALVEDGHEKREAVAAINRLQSDVGVTVEAAAVLYARQNGLDVSAAATSAREELLE